VGDVELVLRLALGEIEGEDGLVAAALEAGLRLGAILQEVGQGRQEEGPEPTARRIGLGEGVPLHERRQEPLDHVLRALIVVAVLADEEVERLPVDVDQGVERLDFLGGLNQVPRGGGEPVLVAHHLGVFARGQSSSS
jgi:hypothetical protein